MSKRAWVLAAALLGISAILLWWALVRPLTESQTLAETLEEYVERKSEYELDAGIAIWRFLSPFSVTVPRAVLTEPNRPEMAIFVAGLTLDMRPSALLSFSPRVEIDSMQFTDLRLTPSTSLQVDDLSEGQGLEGEISGTTNALGQRVWRLEFEGRDVQAQPILDFLGAQFELQSPLDVRGAFTASGSAIETLNETLSGEIHLSGGRGQLDARGIDSINRGVVRWARDSGHFVDWPDLMDFSRLEAKFEVLQGLADTRFAFAFENMSLQGAGGIDFFDQWLDYHFEVQFDSAEEQNTFQAGEYVADVPWPIRCRGSFEDRLPCGLDPDALADLALQLIERDARDRLSRTFGEVFQEFEEDTLDEGA